MAIRSKPEKRYADIVTTWVKGNTSQLLMGEAQNVLDECPMNQRQFAAWAWDLFRITRGPARDMYNKIKESHSKCLSHGERDVGNNQKALGKTDFQHHYNIGGPSDGAGYQEKRAGDEAGGGDVERLCHELGTGEGG